MATLASTHAFVSPPASERRLRSAPPAPEPLAHRPFEGAFARIVAARRACAAAATADASPEMTYEHAAQKYRRLVYQYAHRYARSASLEDLAQEGFVALFAAVDKWPRSHARERGLSFFVFAAMRIQSHLSRVAQYARRCGLTGSHGVELRPMSSMDLDDEHGVTLHELMGTEPREEDACADAEHLQILNEAIARLPERKRAIVSMVRDGVIHDVIVTSVAWGA